MTSSNAQESSEGLPLDGIRVLEFCHTIMGPSAGVLLADMGADVIKIEAAPEGDSTRRLRGFAAGFFYAFNRNKRSLAVDLKSAEGRDIIYRLVESADIVLENFGPGTMDRLQCGYDDFAKVNPRIIYAALKGFLSGPYENRPALDEIAQYMAGLAYMTGPPGQPLRAGASVVDIMGGMFAVIGVQAALHERATTGRGKFIKSALFESTAFLMTQHMAGEIITGETAISFADKRRRGAWAIYEAFDTADDKKLFLGLTSDKHWHAFWHQFERPDMIEDPRFATNMDRVALRDEVRPQVAECFARHSLATLSEICERIGVPFAPVAQPGDLFEDPQLNTDGRMLDINFPGGKSAPLPSFPLEYDGETFPLRRQAPEIGEHSREILAEIGYATSAIEQLTLDEIVVCGK